MMQSKNACSSRGRRRNSDKIFELQLSLVRSILINQKTLSACQGYCLAFQYVRRRFTVTRMDLAGFGWDCSREEVEMQKRNGSCMSMNEAVGGRMSWGQWRKVPSLAPMYAWIQTKWGSLQPNFQLFSLQLFPCTFWTWEGVLLPESTAFPCCWVFLFTLSTQSGLVELRLRQRSRS